MNTYRLTLPDGTEIGYARGYDGEEAVLQFLNTTPGWGADSAWAEEMWVTAELVD